MSSNYLIYDNNNFESVRIAYNNLYEIKMPEGNNGYIRGIERTDGQGKTTNYILPHRHPTLDKGYITKLDNTPQFAIDNADAEKTYEQMEADGWFPSEP